MLRTLATDIYSAFCTFVDVISAILLLVLGGWAAYTAVCALVTIVTHAAILVAFGFVAVSAFILACTMIEFALEYDRPVYSGNTQLFSLRL